MPDKLRCFKDEFQWRKFCLTFDQIGESKLMFVQSKVSCLSPKTVLIYRLIISTYLIFAAICSIYNTNSVQWLVYMTSCNYLLVLLYFCYGFCLSCQAVFCKIAFCRGDRGTVRNNKNVEFWNESILEVDTTSFSTTTNQNRLMSLQSYNSNGSKTRLTGDKFNVDSIILDIENNCNKRNSIILDFNGDKPQNQTKPTENKLRPITSTSEFLVEPITTASCLFQIYWFLSNVALNLSFVVVLVYWFLLYSSQTDATGMTLYLRLDRHGLVLFFIIVDHVISRTPIRFLHFIYPSIMFLLYGAYNGVYTKITGTKVYSAIDFEERLLKSIAMFAVASFAAIPIIQFVTYWLIYRMKERLFGTSSK